MAVSLQLCLALTALLMAVAMPLSKPLLRLMQTPDKYFGYAYWYLFVCFGGIGATVLYNISGRDAPRHRRYKNSAGYPRGGGLAQYRARPSLYRGV